MNNTDSLQGLIDLAVAKRKTSVRQLGFMAQNAGYKVVGTTLSHIRAGRYKSVPSDDTIRAIAYIADVDESVAFAAAGHKAPGPPLADELPPGADYLSPKARKAIIDLTRVLIEYEVDSNHDARKQGNLTPPRKLRAVGTDEDHPGKEQKNSTTDDQRPAGLLPWDADIDPTPPPIERLAAHHDFKTERQKFDETHGERGEESQDSGDF